jgi:hypothetical protein
MNDWVVWLQISLALVIFVIAIRLVASVQQARDAARRTDEREYERNEG